MKKIKHIISVFLIITMIASLSLTAFAYGAGTHVYVREDKIANDLTFYDTVSYDGSNRIESYILEDARGGETFPIVLAGETVYGGERMSDIVKYAEESGYTVLGAINTDFFFTNHIPIGILIEDGVIKSSPENESVLAINSDGSFSYAESTALNITLTNNTNGSTVFPDHLNKMRVEAGGTYLYSEYYSTVSTRTTTDGVAVRFSVNNGEDITDGCTLELTVEDVISGSDAAEIGEDCLVLSAASASGKTDELLSFSVGDSVTLTAELSAPELSRAKWATGAGDMLVSGGRITDSALWDKSISGTNPRSLIGIKNNGTAVYCVVDGRQTRHSAGLSFQKAAEELLDRGCTTVVAFDGGSSSAMSVRMPGFETAKTVNSPPGGEQPCSTYILLCTKSHGSSPKRLSLNENGTVVLKGTSIPLSASAVNGSFEPCSAPEGITYRVSLGSVSGNVYTADTVGTDTVTLSGGGISGSATITVIDALTSLEIRDLADEPLTTLRLENGEGIRFSAVGTYCGIGVSADLSSLNVSLEGDVGMLTGDSETKTFMLNAFGAPGASGSLLISGGGITVSVPVLIKADFADTKEHWSRNYVMALYDEGIVNGITATTFGPDNNIKRGDFILMLYRAAGCPVIDEGLSFDDVPAESYYAAAVSWAAGEGIALGTGDGKFSPTSTLTREQAFTFVYRALGSLDVIYENGSAETELAAFADSGSFSEYAVTPAATLIKLGIVGGSNGKINPKGNLTRGQMSKILCVALGLDA